MKLKCPNIAVIVMVGIIVGAIWIDVVRTAMDVVEENINVIIVVSIIAIK